MVVTSFLTWSIYQNQQKSNNFNILNMFRLYNVNQDQFGLDYIIQTHSVSRKEKKNLRINNNKSKECGLI